jgi:hypothetical protein
MTPTLDPVAIVFAATEQAVLTVVEELDKSKQLVQQGINGALVHSSALSPRIRIGRAVASRFAIQGTFTVPYQASGSQSWDFAIYFREADVNNQYRLIFAPAPAGGAWALGVVVNGKVTYTASGTTLALQVDNGARNTIQLLVDSTQAYLFINDEYVSTFSVAEQQRAGAIFIGVGSISDTTSRQYKRAGASTTYDDFTLWTLR